MLGSEQVLTKQHLHTDGSLHLCEPNFMFLGSDGGSPINTKQIQQSTALGNKKKMNVKEGSNGTLSRGRENLS